MQVLGRLHLDHVFHGHLVGDTLVLLISLVDIDPRVAFLTLHRRFILSFFARHVSAHDDVHAVVLQCVAVPQVPLADSVLVRLRGSGASLLLLKARLAEDVHVGVSRRELSTVQLRAVGAVASLARR